jgi:hypothetical protein
VQVQPRLKLGGIEEIIDPKIKEDCDEELFTKMTELAIRCSSSKRAERPTMKVTKHCPAFSLSCETIWQSFDYT